MATNKDFKVKNGLVAGATITAPSVTIGSDTSSVAGNLGIGNTSPGTKLDVTGDISAKNTGATGGVGYHLQNSEGQFLLYTDGGHLVVKDFAGSATYPFKIEGTAQNDTLVVNTGGDVTIKDQLILGSEIIHSGDTNNKIAFGTDTQTFTTAGSARMTIEADGDIAMTEDLDVAKHFSFNTQHVGGSAGGSTGTENGANTWCKILSWDPGTTQYRDLSLTLGLTCVDVGSQNQAIIHVYGRSNGTNSAHTMGVKIASLASASQLRDDSFKMITEGWGQPIELWMKKYGSYTTWNWNEIAKKLGNSTTLTYSSNSAWQSTEPVKTNGSPQAVRSFGTVIEGRQSVLNLYHNQNVSGLSAGDVLSTISFRKHTGHGGNESIRIYNVQGNSGSSGASDDYHTSDLRISTRQIGTNSYTDRFTILGQEGYVGIGTMSPASLLDVASASTSVIRLSNTDTALAEDQITGEIVFDQSDSTSGGDGISGRIGMRSAVRPDNSQYFGNVADMGFFVSGAADGTASNNAALEAMTIRAGTGNVGIGTTSPGDTLHLTGGQGYMKFGTSGSKGHVKSDYNLELYADDGGNNSSTYQNIKFFTAGSNERMRIDSAGNVGIGTTSPNQILTLEGTMSLKEQASANADTAAYGQLWVKTATPNELYFTTDAGNDIQLTSGTSIAGGGGAVSAVANGSNNRIATFSSADALNGEANLTFNGSTLTVTGAISATTKSFDIEHPTKEGMRLHHGSLEGPEHGVYVRGTLQGDTIELPDYWTGLVNEDTITVQLTANKTFQQLYVDTVKDNKVHIKELTGRNIDCFYFVQAERKDTGRMVVEY